jgi:hypothetical protein
MQYEFSLPTKSDKVPAGAEWIHEIKYDGYGIFFAALTQTDFRRAAAYEILLRLIFPQSW